MVCDRTLSKCSSESTANFSRTERFIKVGRLLGQENNNEPPAMPNPLQNLLTTINGTRGALRPAIQAFPALNVDQLAAELSIDDRAARQAAAGKPTPDAPGPDSEEFAIREEIERHARKAAEEYRVALDLYDSRIRDAVVSSALGVEVESAGESAVSDFSMRAVDDANHLAVLDGEAKGRDSEYASFRRRHGLERLPKIVTTRDRVFRGIVIAIFVTLESVLNGLFFAEGSESGLVGGVTQALVLSMLNVGAAILFAVYGLPLLVHRRLRVKAAGVCALLVYLVWLFGLNLVIAHFRDHFVASAGAVSADALWENFVNAPWRLSDAQSWLLALLGIGFSICALISASGLDDLYMSYGGVGRAREQARRHFNDEKTAALEGFMARRDEAVEQMMQIIAGLERQEHDKELAIDGRNRLHRDFCAHLEHLAAAYQRLVMRYREANEKARTTAPPAYFDEVPGRPPFLEAPPPAELPQPDDEARNEAIERMKHFIKEVNRRMTEHGARYREPDPPHAEGVVPDGAA